MPMPHKLSNMIYKSNKMFTLKQYKISNTFKVSLGGKTVNTTKHKKLG